MAGSIIDFRICGIWGHQGEVLTLQNILCTKKEKIPNKNYHRSSRHRECSLKCTPNREVSFFINFVLFISLYENWPDASISARSRGPVTTRLHLLSALSLAGEVSLAAILLMLLVIQLFWFFFPGNHAFFSNWTKAGLIPVLSSSAWQVPSFLRYFFPTLLRQNCCIEVWV